MNVVADAVVVRRPDRSARLASHGQADRWLRRTAGAWLVTALFGQALFAIYVIGFYGRTALAGHPQRWNEVLPHGYVAGDTFFNLVLALHLAFAVAIIAGGMLQLLPSLRRKVPAFHRWNGRTYLLLAATLGVGGLLMVWVRGDMVGDLSQHLAISLNALLMLVFAGIAWRHARARRINAHRRWALRLFLTVSGVWFFRIGLMLWLVVNGGPVGFDPETFAGPFLTVLAFSQYLLPLAILELYLRVQARRGPRIQIALAAMLGMLTLATAVGTAAAATIMWWPHLHA